MDWDDDMFDEYNRDSYGGSLRAACIILVIILICLAVYMSQGINSVNNDAHVEGKSNDMPSIYDTPSDEIGYDDDHLLIEEPGQCTLCGSESMMIDKSFVCRNEDCPNYGVAVSMDS